VPFADFGLGRSWAPSLWRKLGTEMWAPDVDVFQRNSEFIIKADLPARSSADAGKTPHSWGRRFTQAS
jgi:hypothetical protein